MMAATEWIARAVDERAKSFIELSDRIWDNPELRWQEFDSVAAQQDMAAGAGFRISVISEPLLGEKGRHGDPEGSRLLSRSPNSLFFVRETE